jgi:hypothetical protein
MTLTSPNPLLHLTKLDAAGQVIFGWQAELLHETATTRLARATFNLKPNQVDRIMLLPGDQFLESYFTNAWYNVIEVHDQQSAVIKAWYCNLSFPVLSNVRAGLL